MNRRRVLSACGLALIFLTMAVLVYLRAQLVDRNIGAYIACNGCFHAAVVTADLVMFSLAAGILLLSGFIRPAWLGRVVQMLPGVLILIFVTDLAILRWYNSRLFLSDANLFIANRSAIWDQYFSGLGGWIPSLSVLAGLLFMFAMLAAMPPARSATQRLLLLAILVISLTAGAVVHTPTYVNQWAVDNVFAANLATSERVPYSESVAAGFIARQKPPRNVTTSAMRAPAAGRNVIVVLLESWSAWHSALFGGFENWTPELDEAAESGLRFSNFHSIGFSTDKGLVGILAGQAIWSPFLHWFETPPFHSMWGVDRTLPRVFARAGYQTAFLTTGPLDLYQKGDWLTDLGFDLAEGNESAFYSGMPRFAFGSASDQALYDRAEQWRDTASPPYLLVLETVTSHQPYTDPETGQRSLELAMKFADRAFGGFLRRLREAGFFETGVLLVISDHRSMTPIPEKEFEAFGPDAHSRVPAFIIGEGFGIGLEDDRVHSQADLVPSFELWLRGSSLFGPLQSVMFGDPPGQDQLACAYHSRGDQRGLVEVICNKGRGQVRLDGDRTRFVQNAGLDEHDQSEILTNLAKLRLEGMRRQDIRLEGEPPTADG